MTLYFRSTFYIVNLLKTVEITSFINWYINTTNKHDKYTLNLLPKIAFLILKHYMQLKEKKSACILWATNMHSVVQFPYSPWYNSVVLKHKKGTLIGNMHTKYH